MPTSTVLRATALKAADRLPMVSVVLHRALGLLAQGEDVSIGELGAVIEEDVVITGNVLSIANSALYCRYSTVASVRQAIARLGVNKTRNLLLGLTVTKWFGAARVPGTWSSKRFNSHSLAVATMSDLIAQNTPVKNPEWAFMAGLLHDVGLPLIAVGLPEQFKAIAMQADNDLQIIESERELLGFTHFDLGAEMLARWNCPEIVREATRFCECIEIPTEQRLDLGAAVKSASMLADASALSIFASNENSELQTELLGALEISAPMEFIATFKMEYGGLQACAA